MKRFLFPCWLRKSVRPSPRLSVTPLEDRVTPAVTASVNATTLIVFLNAANDTATLSESGGKITVSGTGFPATDFTGVERVNASDSGTNAGQSLSVTGAGTFDLISGLNILEIETVTVDADVKCSDFVTILNGSVTLSSTIQVSSGGIAIGGPAVTLTGGVIESTLASFVSIAGNTISIDTASKISSELSVEFSPFFPQNSIILGGADSPGTLGLSVAELSKISAPSYSFTTDSGSVTVSNDITFAGAGTTVELIGGSIAINAKIKTDSTLQMSTNDLGSPGSDITISGGAESASGNVILNAGDNVTISGSVTAGDSISIAVDVGSAEITGNAVTITGALSAPNGATLTGNTEADTFGIISQANAAQTVSGGSPAVFPGDTLILDAQNKAVTNIAGVLTVTGAKPVTFNGIETLNFLNVAPDVFTGTDNDDTAILRNNAGVVQFQLNGGTFTNVLGPGVKFQGGKGNDTFTVDLTGGPIDLPGGITFDGELDGGLLRVLGDGTNTGRYEPGVATGDGSVTVDALGIGFQNLQPVDITGMLTFTFATTDDTDVIDVSQGKLFGDATKDAVVVSGTSNGVAFETAAFRDIGTLTIDTTTKESAGKNDAITVNALDSPPLVNNLTLLTAPAVGTGADVVEFKGAPNVPGDLTVTTNTVKVSTATMTTGGAQSHNATAVTLTTDSNFTSTNNKNLTFNAPINGAFNLTATTTGQTILNGAVSVGSVVTNAGGTTQVNGGGVTTTANQAYNDDVTLGADAIFTSTGGDITFSKTVNGAFKLTANANNVNFFGAVGNLTPLVSMTVNATTLIRVAANITTTGSQLYNGLTALFTDVTYTSTGGGSITFGQIENNSNVVVNTAGATSFNGVIGSLVALKSLTTDAGGVTTIAGDITVNDTATFNDSVTVSGTHTVLSVNNKAISFNGTLDGPGALTVTTAGDTTFAKAVGDTTPLGALTADGGGKSLVNGGSVKTTGDQTWSDAVVVGADTTFTSTGAGAVAFNSTLDGAFNVTVNTGGTGTFAGAVTVKALTTDASGSTNVGANVTTTTSIIFNDNVIVTADETFAATTVTFAANLDGAKNVTVNATNTLFGGPVGSGTPLVSLTTDAVGTTQVNGGGVTTTAKQTYNDPITIGTDAVFTSTGDEITFAKTLDGAFKVTATADSVNFFGAVGNLTPLASLTVNVVNFVRIAAGTVTTTGSQSYSDIMALFSDNTFTSNGGGNITFGQVENTFNVLVNTAGATIFNGVVGSLVPLQSLATDVTGATQINGGLITTKDFQSFGDPVTLGAAATAFNSTSGGAITFNTTLNGASAATVNTGGTSTFVGEVGGVTPLTSLKTDAAGNSTVNGDVSAVSLIQFDDDVLLTNDAVFSAATVTFNAKLDGAKNATVNATNTNFNGAVGSGTPLASLTTDAAGSTTVNGGLVATTGVQNFNDAVTVGADTLFNAGGIVTFSSTLSGTFKVNANSPADTTFGGAVTVGILTTDAGGRSRIAGGSIITTGDQFYGDDVLLDAAASLTSTGGNITFNQKLDVAAAGIPLTLSALGNIRFNGPAGSTIPLGQVTVSTASDVTVAVTGSLQATGFQQIAGTGNTRFDGPATITTAAGLDIATQNITLAANVNSVGDITFNVAGTSATQITGSLTAQSRLVLLGTGTFNLNQPGNDIVGSLKVNTGSGDVLVRDANSLTVDAGGIVTASGNVFLNVGTNFTAIDATKTYATPLVNVGTAVLLVQAGLSTTLLDATKESLLVFDAEIKASLAKFGMPGGANLFGDRFNVRPSAFTPLFVYGNLPTPPGIPLSSTVDRLLPDIKGLTVTTFTYDGQDGFYTFVGRQKLQFFGIESLDKLSFSAAAVQTGEPGDGTGATQPVYSVRVGLSQSGANLPSGLDGAGLPQNAFVVSPALIDPRNPYAAPRMAFGTFTPADTIPDLLIANGPGTGALISLIDGQNLVRKADGSLNRLDQITLANGLLAQFYPYSPAFTGGLNVAAGDVDGTNRNVIITAPDAGGGPQIRILRYDDVQRTIVEAVPSFFAFEGSFRGGTRVAFGDVNKDGFQDVVVAAGIGGGPRVRVFNGKDLFTTGTTVVIRDFFAYADNFRGGVFVDVADYNDDGFADILTGPGRGGSDHIRVFSGVDLKSLAGFFAGIGKTINDPLFGGGEYRLGVGGVAFTAGSNGVSRDILVSSPRSTIVKVIQFTGNGANPTASKSFFDNPTVSPINPSVGQLFYGATVAGFDE